MTILDESDFGGLLERATVFRFNDHPTDTHTANRSANWITVEQRMGYYRTDDDSWAVCIHSRCLGSDGLWDWEPIPSSRTDKWLATHRFPRGVALAIAYRIEQGLGAGRRLVNLPADEGAEVDRIIKAATLAVLAEVHAWQHR